MSGPTPIARGWYASPFGAVDEVWAFGRDGLWVWVNADGRIVMTGSGDVANMRLRSSKADAIAAVIESADAELTRARAAVDRLRAELASADAADPLAKTR